MSLLEDVFLEDETNEAQELERIIEGDEYDERPRSAADNSDENSEKEDEAEEDKRRVDPNTTKIKRVVKNPRVTLNPARLTGPRGIQMIPEHFKDFKFKGKGHEKEDLDFVLKKLEHWAYRLYPKFGFEDCLKKIETLGKKRPVAVHLHKIRSDQYMAEDTVVQKDSSDDEATANPQQEDEFDKLLQQQIEIARATPTPGSVKKPGFNTPKLDNRSPIIMPKATSSPSISDEQKERMMRNRRLAEERRLSKFKQNIDNSNINNTSVNIEVADVVINEYTDKKNNRSNVIDSSDDESELVKHSVTVHMPKTNNGHTQNKETPIGDQILKKNNRSCTTESSDNESESHLVIGLEGHNKGINKNKMETDKSIDLIDTNQTDSSDEECNIQSLNYSVTIDVQNDKNSERVTSKIESVDTNVCTDKVEESDNNSIDTPKNEQNIEKFKTKFTDVSIEVAGNIEQSKEITNTALRENDKVSVDKKNKSVIDKTMVYKQNDFKNKENVDHNVISKDFEEDLMDIDFNEEF